MLGGDPAPPSLALSPGLTVTSGRAGVRGLQNPNIFTTDQEEGLHL